jgi:hypothetical protein
VEPAAATPALSELETQATQAAVRDIKAHDPELYKKIESMGSAANADAIDTLNINQKVEQAPEAPVPPATPSKPGFDELDKGKDPYKSNEWQDERR